MNFLYSMINKDTIFLNIADLFYPDKSLDEFINPFLLDIIGKDNITSYEYFEGNPELREKISRKVSKKSGLDLEENNVLITNGAIEALLLTIISLFDKGDEIITIDPSYNKNFTIPGALSLNLVTVESNPEENFKLPIEGIEASINQKTKGIIITNPNNPTTRVYSYKELKELSDLAKKHDLYIVSDQAYEDIIYEDYELTYISAIEGMLDRTITISSASKGYGLSGFRVGWLYSSKDNIEKIKKTMSLCFGASNTLAQKLMIKVIDCDEIMERNKSILKRRRDYFYNKISELNKVKMIKPMAGFYAWLNVLELGDSEEVALKILKEKNILVNPGTYYGPKAKGYIRVIYGAYKSDEKIFSYIDQIVEVLKSLELNN